MQDLIMNYARTGIIQVGRFQQPNGSFAPITLNFLLLPSYPEVMQATARALVPMVKSYQPERLLTTRAALPLGSVLAVESGIPLTYPYGEAKSYTSAYTIEGAYDVGHPTTLLTDVLTDGAEELELIAMAGKVGLRVQHVIALFRLGQPSLKFSVEGLFDLEQALDVLMEHGQLTKLMQDAILSWIKQES